jgi:hypothetical protein
MVSRRSLKKYKFGKKSKIHKSNVQIGGDDRWTQFLGKFMVEYRFESYRHLYKKSGKSNTFIQDINKNKKNDGTAHIHVFDDQSGMGINHFWGSQYHLGRLESGHFVNNIEALTDALVHYWNTFPKIPKINLPADLASSPTDSLWSPFLIRIIQELFKSAPNVKEHNTYLINPDTIKKLRVVFTSGFFRHLKTIGLDYSTLILIINNLSDEMFNKLEYVNNCFEKLTRFNLDIGLGLGMRRIVDEKLPLTYSELINILYVTQPKIKGSFWHDPIEKFKKKIIDKIKSEYNYISFNSSHPGWQNINDFFVCLSSKHECTDVNPKPPTHYALKYNKFDPTKNINRQIKSQLNSICERQRDVYPSICTKFSNKLLPPPELYLRNSEQSNYLCKSFIARQNNYTAMYLLYNFINSKLNPETFLKTKHDQAGLSQHIKEEQILHIFYVLICNQSGISDASNIILEMNDFEYIDKLNKLYELSTQIHAQITY